MTPFQLQKHKNQLRQAAVVFANKAKTSIKLNHVDYTVSVDKENGEDRIDEVILVITAPNGGPTELRFPVSTLHLGDEPEKWPARFAERLPTIKQQLRHRAAYAANPARRELPGAGA